MKKPSAPRRTNFGGNLSNRTDPKRKSTAFDQPKHPPVKDTELDPNTTRQPGRAVRENMRYDAWGF